MQESFYSNLFVDVFYHYAALAGCVVLTVCAQLFLKRGASNNTSVLSSFLNPWTIIGCGLFCIVTILSVYAMQEVELKTVTAWISTSYLLVVILALLIYKEVLTSKKIIGCLLIVIGIITFSMA